MPWNGNRSLSPQRQRVGHRDGFTAIVGTTEPRVGNVIKRHADTRIVVELIGDFQLRAKFKLVIEILAIAAAEISRCDTRRHDPAVAEMEIGVYAGVKQHGFVGRDRAARERLEKKPSDVLAVFSAQFHCIVIPINDIEIAQR